MRGACENRKDPQQASAYRDGCCNSAKESLKIGHDPSNECNKERKCLNEIESYSNWVEGKSNQDTDDGTYERDEPKQKHNNLKVKYSSEYVYFSGVSRALNSI